MRVVCSTSGIRVAHEEAALKWHDIVDDATDATRATYFVGAEQAAVKPAAAVATRMPHRAANRHLTTCSKETPPVQKLSPRHIGCRAKGWH